MENKSKVILIIITIFIFISCKNKVKKESIELKISQIETIHNDSIIILKIINNKDNKVAILIDDKFYNPASNSNNSLIQYALNQIIMSNDSKEEIISISSPTTPIKEKKVSKKYDDKNIFLNTQINWIYNDYNNKKNILKIIQPNDTVIIPILLSLKNKIIFTNNEQFILTYNLKKRKKYYFQIAIKQDEKLIDKKISDSLKKSNIELFNGIIKSNRIKIRE